MITRCSRYLSAFILLGVSVVFPVAVSAQQATDAQQTQQPTPPTPPGSGEQVAAGEEGHKETRSFFSALFHNLGDDIKHIPRKNTLFWVAGGGAAALLIHPEDNKLNRRLRGSGPFDTVVRPGKYIGALPFLLGSSTTTYIVGRASGKKRVQHIGLDLIEGTILAEGITRGIKEIVRRERPLREDNTRASGFAFPSGHAAGTFAAATIFQQHLGWKAAIPTYAVASLVAVSRMHDERHFASDVVAGATEGIIIGRSVTWHGRNFYASPMLLPHGGGVIVNVPSF